MMRRHPAILAFMLVFLPVGATACSCVAYDTIEEQIESMDAIFYGVAEETHWVVSNFGGLAMMQSTKFRVYEVLKGGIREPLDGEAPEFVYIRHPKGDRGNCGLNLYKGLAYEVFASSDKDSLYSSLCHGTRLAPEPIEYGRSWDEYREALGKTH